MKNKAQRIELSEPQPPVIEYTKMEVEELDKGLGQEGRIRQRDYNIHEDDGEPQQKKIQKESKKVQVNNTAREVIDLVTSDDEEDEVIDLVTSDDEDIKPVKKRVVINMFTSDDENSE